VGVSVSFNDREDETSVLCKFQIPDHHFLESWGDAEIKTGYLSFIQPTIAPLFKTRAFQTSLLKWSGDQQAYGAYFKAYWMNRFGSQSAWDKALQDGVVETAASATAGSFNGTSVSTAATALASVKSPAGKQLVLSPKVAIGSGKEANNPWLQEMPDPITKATWDNYAIISFATAKELGIVVDDNYEVEVTKPVIKVKVGQTEMSLPVLVIPGMHKVAEALRGVPGLGVILVALVIFSTGVFVANMFGQWWLRQWDSLMNRIPVVRTIYTSVKQVADTLFSGSGNAFSKALLVQYPRQGVWTIAFLTGTPGGEVAKHLNQPMVSVYVPTTPNPTSGFFLMMPKADVVELDMTVDDALKYIISMGVVVPGPQALKTLPDNPDTSSKTP
jgi:uncharacterized membrane protein